MKDVWGNLFRSWLNVYQRIGQELDPLPWVTWLIACFSVGVGSLGLAGLDHNTSKSLIWIDFSLALYLFWLGWLVYRRPQLAWPRWLIVLSMTSTCLIALSIVELESAAVILITVPILLAIITTGRLWPIFSYPFFLLIASILHPAGWSLINPAVIVFNLLLFLTMWQLRSSASRATQIQVQAKAQLEQEQQARQFIRFFQHELRGYSSGLEGLVPMFERFLANAPQKNAGISSSEALAALQTTTQQLKQLTSQLLILTREGVLQPQQLQTLNVAELLHKIVNEVRTAHQFDQNYLQVAVCNQTPILIKGNDLFLSLALRTIIQNSIEASLISEQQITLECSVKQAMVIITISDHGTGYPKELLQRLASNQIPAVLGWSGKLGGNGLGLALIMQVARLHQGSVSFENHAHGGACTTLALPCLQAINDDVAHGTGKPTLVQPAPCKRC
ncbi:sensor histidine kinase [Herpetosiphon sp. NSE202]|uniref:sensor histidine kinase n=1 Tax=Herpetosiphon sp. NSE202 TaxID=3351349 RepID=UPI003634517C